MPDPVKETPVEPEVEEPSALELSDEEFEKLQEPQPVETPVEESPAPEPIEEEPPATDESEKQDEERYEETPGETPELPEKETVSEKTETVDEGGAETVPEKQETPAVDYEAEYKKLIAPFKANGTEMQIKSVDDAIRLMQMGANYHHKMAGLKPSLKTLKLLEKNDLLDPEKINYLIDLHNKNPEAITKLLKDSQMNPLDINTEEESNYKPTQRTVDDSELALDSVLEEIRNTPTYSKTLTVVTEQWDDTSRNTIAKNPHILSVINEHVGNGTYDKVMGAVAYERSMGKLQGISDFDAYQKVGDVLQAANQLPAYPVSAPQPQAIKPPATQTHETAEEIERKKRKKAASPTKSSGTPALKTFNPLSLSDEEFEKFDPKHFQIKS